MLVVNERQCAVKGTTHKGWALKDRAKVSRDRSSPAVSWRTPLDRDIEFERRRQSPFLRRSLGRDQASLKVGSEFKSIVGQALSVPKVRAWLSRSLLLLRRVGEGDQRRAHQSFI